ncbi:DUF2254 family protein [Yinghuangia soli]|uniref:DUF2254 domain-containing protein n=1 Tax=Yinghuangia soli TaxID=2908204 RepID=A0AA41U8T3_9ACTN|nr:DUF2254 family protein [Yinghuangia soli]MCF2533219.1 DUF2254 domain-containing protein [Yinghuangia soli]
MNVERIRSPRGRSRPARFEKGGRIGSLAIIVGGGFLGWALPNLEPHLPSGGLGFSASTAQAALAAIAAAMITLAGFVLTAVTLVIQTIQAMSPRLVGALHYFGRFLTVFALLVGTALYALVALSHVDSDETPRLAVTFAVALVLFDTIVVLNMLAALRSVVTGGGLSRAVGERLHHVVEDVYPAAYGESGPVDPDPGPAADGLRRTDVRFSGRPGTVSSFDERELVAWAARTGCRIEMTVAVGDFVGGSARIAQIAAPPGTDVREPAAAVSAALGVGPTRTFEQDPAYGLRLLADIAIRALSPAVNDPTTAVQALDQIEDALLKLSGRALGTFGLVDDEGGIRVRCPAPSWSDLVSLALDEILLYGAGNPQIARRLRALIARVDFHAPQERHEPLLERLALLDRMVPHAAPDPHYRTLSAAADLQGLGGPERPGFAARRKTGPPGLGGPA